MVGRQKGGEKSSKKWSYGGETGLFSRNVMFSKVGVFFNRWALGDYLVGKS